MMSSHTSRRRNLVTTLAPDRAEQLLQLWANLADVSVAGFRDEVESLTESFPEIFAALHGLHKASDGEGSDEEDYFRSLWGIREHLRAAWQATGLREREWYIYELRKLYVRHTETSAAPAMVKALESARDRIFPQDVQSQSGLNIMEIGAGFRQRSRFWGFMVDPPPALTAFERVMFHFQRIAHRARKCENPECVAPYFLRKRKGQKYCTPECALPAQRNSKNEWWARNREEQTKKRKQKRQAAKAARQESRSTKKSL